RNEGPNGSPRSRGQPRQARSPSPGATPRSRSRFRAMALLARRRQPPKVDDTRMSVIEHLEALRRALIIASVGWLAATAVAYVFHNQVFAFLIQRSHLHVAYLMEPTAGVF